LNLYGININNPVEKKSITLVDYPVIYKFYNNQLREVSLYMKDNEVNSFVFAIKDVVTFECNIDKSEIFYKFYSKGTEQLLEYWLYHTLMPIYLTISNTYYFLHACAVRVEEKSILFMANSMGGKSTMTDYFMKQGHTLISDDKVGCLNENNLYKIVPSYPYHRPYRKFEDLGYKVDNFEKNKTNLNIIYILDVNEIYNEVSLKELSGLEKFSHLISGTEIGLPLFQEERFKFVSDLANKVQMMLVSIPKDLSRLSESYEEIIKYTKGL